MNNILIVVNTYYQLILALQLKNTIFKHANITIMLSDHSNGSEQIFHNVSNYQVFDKTFYSRTKGIRKNRGIFERLRDFKSSMTSHNRYSKYLDADESIYDELIFFNYFLDVYGLFAAVSTKNKNVKVSMFEEGILSYNSFPTQTRGQKTINMLRHIMSKPIITNNFASFYCFYPELYKGTLNPVPIPRITATSETADVLRKIFHPDLSRYTQRYIFFTSVYDFEGGAPIGEFEIVCKVAELVGKDNLLIKIHPRDSRTIYLDNGFNVDINCSIPWEVIQLSSDFSDKVFLTVNSGSVLAGSFMSEKPVRTFYMYRLCKASGNTAFQKSIHDIDSLLQNKDMNDILSNVSIADKLEDIING